MYVLFLYLCILAVAAAVTFALFGEVGEADVAPTDALTFFAGAPPSSSTAAEKEEEDPNAAQSRDSHSKESAVAASAAEAAADSSSAISEGVAHIGHLLTKCGVPLQQQEMISFLGQHCCVLPVESHTVRVLTHPTVFYEELKKKVMAAQRSITLSALYIGDGPLSTAFVGCLEEKVRWAAAGGHPFSITILLDFNRMQDRKNLVTMRTLMELAERTGNASLLPTEACDASAPHSASSRSFSSEKEEDFDKADDETGSEATGVTVRLFLYQNPSKWNRFFAPLGRATEVLGVQHTKIFVFDQRHTLLTGANLSDDYFATRMDRYLVVEDNPLVGQWFARLVRTLNRISHPVVCRKEFAHTFPAETALVHGDRTAAAVAASPSSPARRVLEKAGCIVHFPASPSVKEGSPTLHRKSNLVILPNALGMDPSTDTAAFCAKTKELLHGFASWARQLCAQQRVEWSRYDSVLFPTLQFGRAGVYHDSVIVKQLLRLSTAEDHIFLTSPYLNMYSSFVDELLRGSSYVDCITASVQTNGWNGQRGMAGRIPLFYLQLERSFYYLMKAYHCLRRVRIREFSVDGLTFHAKGLWFAGHEPSHPASPVSTTAAAAAAGAKDVEVEKQGGIDAAAATCCPASISAPYLVAYGSTNYGYRSVHKDVEAEAFLLTTNNALRATLRRELLFLLERSVPVTEEAFVGTAMGRFQPVISLIAHLGQDFL
ncbi:putative mitochondrial Phosphatidylglycerophosphate synthase-like protein [Leptomonas pyrrhocoris]|uniref:CDP-diacylglycerol--glycerol-3-phosphate 3-phosphatidyltransferase n=1 Tax=Leptomonas pyrrhocoris TaxID=157538 RepID=A0A0M9FPA5_LEPPY|nr:putative mitochondrial Phosphatidylglycerophosphate synthase-like protein [Leptomonas pyrrhocoris]KPA73203.1 putative mitochondrial Phosphatidylglycerophosphate synthase-like protein [Leptomonas pyrrhocoris]|eukprot:XP_015651642.1 putative mitochondrial Phosphatidylglycerophosphate synthase-like protein [Leptomonas pyrrhocoris]